jgi:hypothetical protein
MKLTPKEIARQHKLRQLGEGVNDTDERNRENWKAWQGLDILMIYQAEDPKLILKVAFDLASPPPYVSGVDLTKSVVSDPTAITDARVRVLVKWRKAIEELAEAGIVPQQLYEEVPQHDPKENLRAITAVIYEELGKHKQGQPALVDRVRDVCVEVGEPYFAALSPETKEGILLGALVHPRALKPIHKHAVNEQPKA